jgi:hypothetical protein
VSAAFCCRDDDNRNSGDSRHDVGGRCAGPKTTNHGGSGDNRALNASNRFYRRAATVRGVWQGAHARPQDEPVSRPRRHRPQRMNVSRSVLLRDRPYAGHDVPRHACNWGLAERQHMCSPPKSHRPNTVKRRRNAHRRAELPSPRTPAVRPDLVTAFANPRR